MAGKLCPKCGNFTLFETLTGRKCTKCGYGVYVPPNNGKGGRGQKCPICNSMSMFNGKCTKCGAKEM
ncbi:MAG: hypothetical protein K2K16_02405 [Ruminococcus sp.]|nr:hypothetical protein [Ruminococcus sp.]